MNEQQYEINKTCPVCKMKSTVDLKMEIFTDENCIICYEKEKKIIFSGCKHGVICKNCCLQLKQ